MRATTSRVALRVLPPAAVDILKKARRPHGGLPEWEFVSHDWPKGGAAIFGWNHESIAAVQRSKWDDFRRIILEPRPLGVSHEAVDLSTVDHMAHNLTMTFGYVLGRASRGLDHFSLLDWGGGIGHYFLLSRALFPDLTMEYHCKDLDLLCAQGRELLPDGHFHSDEACLQRTYDLVMASTSLHYSEDWERVAAGLVAATDRYLYIANVPIVQRAKSFAVVQRPHRYGYETEYVCWFLNRQDFLHRMEILGVELVREFLLQARPEVAGAPEQGEYRGFLFTATSQSVEHVEGQN